MKNEKKYFEDKLAARIWITELFARYSNGRATDKEKKAIENWNPEAGKTTYNATVEEIEKGCETMWQRLSDEFGFELAKEQTAVAKKSRVIQMQNYVKYVAAVVVLTLGIGIYYYSSQDSNNITQPAQIAMEYFQSGAGAKKQVKLPDGSIVYLNNDTRIGIAKAYFDKEKREIWLEEGEAFFEVAKNPEKPFIVHTQNLETTVKGTSFNVQSYAELDHSSVSVRSGKVEVRNGKKLIGELIKNRQITYNKVTGAIEKSEANWQDAAAWRDSRLVMKDANAKELKMRLKQQYGVELILQNNILQGTSFTSSFERQTSLKEVLDVISVLYDVKYDISKPGKVVFYK